MDTPPRSVLPETLRLEGPVAVRALWTSGSAGCLLDGRTEIVVGRDPSCDLVIDDRSVSRRHALLYVDDEPVIEDLGSTAGTTVSGRKIQPRQPTSVPPGAIIEVGTVVLVLPQGPAELSVPTPTHEVLGRVARSPVGVLVSGEPGTGKETLAREAHRVSGRSGPLVVLRGAEVDDVRAALAEAAGGTLFVDDVDQLSPSAQADLVHELRLRPPDVRLVSATTVDLGAASTSGRFREDLYWALAGVVLRMPPLRDRVGDLPAVAGALLADIAGPDGPAFSGAALEWICARPWPGNLRELREVLERAVVIADELVEPSHLER